MFKRDNELRVCIEKDVTLKDCARNSSIEQKLHDCSLRWSIKCYHGDYGYDDCTKMLSSSNKFPEDVLSDIEDKIYKCDFKIKG